jgi:hypothetical protein
LPGHPPGLLSPARHPASCRAKAGGKQSSKDATGKFARSAGSRLRRYNEVALQRDIAQLLCDWRPLLAAADLLFINAPASNQQVLVAASAAAVGMLPSAADGAAAAAAAANASGSGAPAAGGAPSTAGKQQPPLDLSDPRVRRVPFVTKRPTLSEAKRVVWLLGAVREAPSPAAAPVQAPDGAAAAAGEAATSAGPRPGAAEAAAEQLAAASLEGGPEGGSSAGAGSPAKAPEEPPLIKAAKAGDTERVMRLLQGGHDPTTTDSKGRAAYQLAASKEVRGAWLVGKEGGSRRPGCLHGRRLGRGAGGCKRAAAACWRVQVRDAMRRFMAEEPDRWDYAAAGIPSALTAELEAEQAAKKVGRGGGGSRGESGGCFCGVAPAK